MAIYSSSNLDTDLDTVQFLLYIQIGTNTLQQIQVQVQHVKTKSVSKIFTRYYLGIYQEKQSNVF